MKQKDPYTKEKEGPGYETFVNSAKAACITHHKAKEPPIDKTEAQIAAYCECYAKDRASFASDDDLDYMARNKTAPPDLKRLLDDHAPECARRADAVGK
jgi:hypothetical protein